MEKVLDLKVPGVIELGKEEMKKIDGGGILARTLGKLVGSLTYQTQIAGTYYYQDGNYMYSPLR
jgi:hypothetical protein